ncbi:MAG: TolC family protein [Pseudomonadota bacterium]|nr:TolC family protein [Pseudomonadota bacterium]
MIKINQMGLIRLVFISQLLSGCSIPFDKPMINDVSSIVTGHVSEELNWRIGKDANQFGTRVEDMLANPLTNESVVAIALLSNSRFQVKFTEFGISQNELTQSGVLENPFSEIVFKPSTEGGRVIEFGIVANLFDILTLPARRKILEKEYRQNNLDFASEIIIFTHEVIEVFYQYINALNKIDIHRSLNEIASDGYDLAVEFNKAGNISDLDLAQYKSAFNNSTLELLEAEKNLSDLRINFEYLLGINNKNSYVLPKKLPDFENNNYDFTELNNLALKNRIDLQALRIGLEVQKSDSDLSKDFFFINDGEISFGAEHESGGGWELGPGVHLPLPLFDRGELSEKDAVLKLERLKEILKAEEDFISSDLKRLLEEINYNSGVLELLRDDHLPLSKEITRLTLSEYNFMLLGAYEVLEAKQSEYENEIMYLDALLDYWLLRNNLNILLGGIIKSGEFNASK